MPDARRLSLTFILLGFLAAAFSLAFMLYDIKGALSFTLPFRAGKLLALILVAYAIAISTVLFQTITHNRILTPSLMGFDRLYILIQTGIIFAAGAGNLSLYNQTIGFFISSALLVLFAGGLFYGLFIRRGKDLQLVLLAGIIFGILFRSLTSFLNRMLDPSAFAVLQDSYFANFNNYNGGLLAIAACIIIGVSLIGLPMLAVFDVLALGRENAVNLGIDYRRTAAKILLLITLLVAVSTALVGPVSFFGLLVANLAYSCANSRRHKIILPMAALIAIIALVGGQFILERLFRLNTALSIIIEFIGGIIFIFMLIKGKIK